MAEKSKEGAGKGAALAQGDDKALAEVGGKDGRYGRHRGLQHRLERTTAGYFLKRKLGINREKSALVVQHDG